MHRNIKPYTCCGEHTCSVILCHVFSKCAPLEDQSSGVMMCVQWINLWGPMHVQWNNPMGHVQRTNPIYGNMLLVQKTNPIGHVQRTNPTGKCMMYVQRTNPMGDMMHVQRTNLMGQCM